MSLQIETKELCVRERKRKKGVTKDKATKRATAISKHMLLQIIFKIIVKRLFLHLNFWFYNFSSFETPIKC